MSIPPETLGPIVHVNFETDGLYFSEAVRRAEELHDLESVYADRRERTDALNRQIREIEARYGESAAAYDETESLVISLVDGVFVELQDAARALAGASTVVQILSAACLEAHINVRAADALPGALYGEFECAGLGGKWLLYPALRGLNGLDAGTAVMRDVQELARRRNALVHPKRERVKDDLGFRTPDFLERKNLTAEAARHALATAKEAVTVLARAEGRPVPAWLQNGFWSLFRHDWNMQV